MLIPEAGQYTFETSAVDGACGLALEGDTVLKLYNGSGSLLHESDDIDGPHNNFCSKITATLELGTHYLEVSGIGGGRYRVQARPGS